MIEKKIVEVNDLKVTYPDSKVALNDLNLVIKEGEFVVIMGRTGSGKSTLARTICGLIPRVIKADLKGTIKICGGVGEDTAGESFAGNVGIVFEDFESQLFSSNVLLEVAFVLENFKMAPNEMRRRCQEVLSLLKITHLGLRNILTLSGGEKQLVAIASVISGNFKIIILDEPTTDLDPFGKSLVYDTLNRITNTRIFIDDDPERALKADRVLILGNGKVIAQGSPSKLLTANRLLLENGIRPIDTNQIFPGILTVDDALRHIKENRIEIRKVDFTPAVPEIRPPIIECQSVSFSYNKGAPLLAKINLMINRGDFLAIIGQNGSGKTTLAKLLCGLLIPQSGEIKIKNKNIRHYTRRELAVLIGYVFQNPDHQIFCDTVREEIAFGLKNFGWNKEQIESAIREALEVCDLKGYEEKDPFSLSRGEKQRLAMATVLAFKPEIIILDEPTTGLDYNQQKSVMDVLRYLNKRGYTIIIITHTMWLVAEYTDRTVVMAQGRIVLDKKTREVFQNEEELIKCHLEPPQVCRLGNRLGLNVLTIEEFKQCISM
ncbi:MAG: energy-coupling factor transporter ATPase [candidate division WOR-3 bacterium]